VADPEEQLAEAEREDKHIRLRQRRLAIDELKKL
jgi:hypothetical protein